jgi:hypothetical protein
MMDTFIVVDDHFVDTAATELATSFANEGSAMVITLSEFLKKAGVSYDAVRGELLYVAKPEVPLDKYQICNRVISISDETASIVRTSGKAGGFLR